MVALRLFGHPVIEQAGTRTQIAARSKAIALLAVLAANHTRPLSREWLAQSLWPDDDPTDARANLRRHLHLLAKAVGDDAFVLTRHTAQWNAHCAVNVDVIRFDSLALSEPALAIQEYGGELCAGVEDEILDGLRLRYRSAYEALLRKLIDSARGAGDDTSLALWLQHAINHDPLDEAAVREFMRLRNRHGDRAGALREYGAFAQRLRSELGSEPDEETLALFSEIAADNPAAATPNNLRAPATTFVGRERELAATIQALRSARIITLLGAGGIGKTRLATRTCFDVLSAWDGIWFVELEHARSAASIWDSILQSMRLPSSNSPEPRVLESLANKRTLIVLDTCEHVIDDAREIAERITEKTPANILCTSRRALRAQGERTIEIGPLEIPPAETHAGESPLRYGAYRLFLERAAAINPTFQVSARQTRALGEILQRADGLPLAIELIASRANVLTIEGMRTRLAAAMRTARRNAAGGRAQTIDDAIAWSYELLSQDQRMLFAWLSTFSGRFTIDDVERVCDSIPHAVEALLELVDASLVAIVSGDYDAQYRLLETTRAFASARLSEGGGEHGAFLAHAKHVAQKADGHASLSTLQYDLRATEIAAQMPDYLAALERCVRNGWIALGVRILEGVHRYGQRRYFCEDLLRHTLALLECGQADAATAARLHRFVSMFAPVRGLLPLAREHAEKACEFYRETGDEQRLCEALGGLAVISYESARYSDCEKMLLEVRDRTERIGDQPLFFKTLARLGSLYLAYRDLDRTMHYLAPAIGGLREHGEVHQLAWALKNLAIAAYYSGEQERAIAYASEALELPSAQAESGMRAALLCLQACAHRELGNLREALHLLLAACPLIGMLGNTPTLAEALEDVATTLSFVREYEAAAQLVGYAAALRERIGAEMNPGLRDYYDRTTARLEAALGPAFGTFRAKGEMESLDSLISLAQSTAEQAVAAK